MGRHSVILALLLVMVSAPSFADISYTPVQFDYNGKNWVRDYYYPTGNGVLLGDVPFNIPAPDNLNTWDSNDGAGLKEITIPMNIYGVSEVHTLINLSWGSYGAMNTWITFEGSDGATYTKYLYDGIDVRDWYQGGYANSINGTTSVAVYENGRSRVDKQFIDLPDDFLGQYLVSMTISDNGGSGYHRAFLYGLTVGNTVPEPISTTLFILGGATLAARRLRRKN